MLGKGGLNAAVDGNVAKKVGPVDVNSKLHADAHLGKDGARANASVDTTAKGKVGNQAIDAKGGAKIAADSKTGVKASGGVDVEAKGKVGNVNTDVKAGAHVQADSKTGVTGDAGVSATATGKVGNSDVKAAGGVAALPSPVWCAARPAWRSTTSASTSWRRG